VRYWVGVLSGWCAIGLVCFRVGALSGLCAIYFVCYRDVGYRVGAVSGIVSIFRVLSGWCAIAPCANGTRSMGTSRFYAGAELIMRGIKRALGIITARYSESACGSKHRTKNLPILITASSHEQKVESTLPQLSTLSFRPTARSDLIQHPPKESIGANFDTRSRPRQRSRRLNAIANNYRG